MLKLKLNFENIKLTDKKTIYSAKLDLLKNMLIIISFKNLSYLSILYYFLKYHSFAKCAMSNSNTIMDLYNSNDITLSKLDIKENGDISLGLEGLDLHFEYISDVLESNLSVYNQPNHLKYPKEDITSYFNKVINSKNTKEILINLIDYYDEYFNIIDRRLRSIYLEIKSLSDPIQLLPEDNITYEHFINLGPKNEPLSGKMFIDFLEKHILYISILLQTKDKIKIYSDILKLELSKFYFCDSNLNILYFTNFINNEILDCFIGGSKGLKTILDALCSIKMETSTIDTFPVGDFLRLYGQKWEIKIILFTLYRDVPNDNSMGLIRKYPKEMYNDKLRKEVEDKILSELFFTLCILLNAEHKDTPIYKNLKPKHNPAFLEQIFKGQILTFENVNRLYSLIFNTDLNIEDY